MTKTMTEALEGLVAQCRPNAAHGVNAVIQLDIVGEEPGSRHITIANGHIDLAHGAVANPTVILKMSTQDWLDFAAGKLDGVKAFMTGRLKVQGNLSVLLQFAQLLQA